MHDFTKTVFISYRREDETGAISVYAELQRHGYYPLIDRDFKSGRFPEKIKNSILASGHFIVILTPDSLERCSSETDWLRLEIEIAMSLLPDMNIIPFFFQGFSFEKAANDLHAAGDIVRHLADFNGVEYVPRHFDRAIAVLRDFIESFSFQNRKSVATTIPDNELSLSPEQLPTSDQFTAYDYYLLSDKYFEEGRYADAIRHATKSIELDPTNAQAFHTRGFAYHRLDEYALAAADYQRAICLNPHLPVTFNNLATLKYLRGEFSEALIDLNIATAINSRFVRPYFHRGNVLIKLSRHREALQQFQYYVKLGGDKTYKHEAEVQQLIAQTTEELMKLDGEIQKA